MLGDAHSAFLASAKTFSRWLILAVGFAAGCRPTSAPAPAVPANVAAPLHVAVMTVTRQTWPTMVRTQGSLIADEVATVGAKVAGRVVEVAVDLGDRVGAGDPLVALDREELRLAVAQAEAQLMQARAAVGLKPTDDVSSLDPLNAPPVREAKAVWDEAVQRVKRLRQLRDQNTVSSAELEQGEASERVAEARYSSALNSVREKLALISVQHAELKLAEQRLADAVTPAPFAGYVKSRLVAPGTYVQVGNPLIELVRTSTLRFRGAIPERFATAVQAGQEIKLKIESVAEPRLAKITRVSPTLDEQTRSLTFESAIDNDDATLRSGLFAEAEVVLDPQAEALVVPNSSLVRGAGIEKVWKVTDGNASEVVVRLGRSDGRRTEVLSGVTVGDTILLDGSAGQMAQVIPLPSEPPPTATSSRQGSLDGLRAGR